jgi:hypothetical protein
VPQTQARESHLGDGWRPRLDAVWDAAGVTGGLAESALDLGHVGARGVVAAGVRRAVLVVLLPATSDDVLDAAGDGTGVLKAEVARFSRLAEASVNVAGVVLAEPEALLFAKVGGWLRAIAGVAGILIAIPCEYTVSPKSLVKGGQRGRKGRGAREEGKTVGKNSRGWQNKFSLEFQVSRRSVQSSI